jgi:hypothetical protein
MKIFNRVWEILLALPLIAISPRPSIASDEQVFDCIARVVSSVRAFDLSAEEVADRWNDEGNSYLQNALDASDHVELLLRACGVPVFLLVPLTDTALKAEAMSSLDVGLPVLVTGGGACFVLESYTLEGGVTLVFSVYDPCTGSTFGSTISDLTFDNAQGGAVAIDKGVFVAPNVDIEVFGLGAVAYDVAGDSLSPSGGLDSLSIDAIKSVSPFVAPDQAVLLLKDLRDSGQTLLSVALLSKEFGEDRARGVVRDTLGDWYDSKINRSQWLFPLFCFGSEGSFDFATLGERLDDLSVLYRVIPGDPMPCSRSPLSSGERQKAEDAYNWWTVYHIFDDRRLGLKEALRGIASQEGALTLESSTPFSDMLVNAGKLVADELGDMASDKLGKYWSNDLAQFAIDKGNAIWNQAFNDAQIGKYGTRMGWERAAYWADYSSRHYDQAAKVTVKLNPAGMCFKSAFSIGTNAVERLFAVNTAWSFSDEAGDEFELIIPMLLSSGPESDIRQGMSEVSNEIDQGGVKYWEEFFSLVNSGEFWGDVALDVGEFVGEKLLALMGVPGVGQFILAVKVGFIVGDLLGNTEDISAECEKAKYAKDVEEVLHGICYDDSDSVYRQIANRLQSGQAVDTELVRQFKSLGHIVLLSESYYYHRVSQSLRFQDEIALEDWCRSFWNIFGANLQDPGPVSESYLRCAQDACEWAAWWSVPRVADEIRGNTMKRVWAADVPTKSSSASPPNAPAWLYASPGDSKVFLSWPAVQGEGITYIVFRSDAPGGPYAMVSPGALSVREFTDVTVANDKTYYWLVTRICARKRLISTC